MLTAPQPISKFVKPNLSVLHAEFQPSAELAEFAGRGFVQGVTDDFTEFHRLRFDRDQFRSVPWRTKGLVGLHEEFDVNWQASKALVSAGIRFGLSKKATGPGVLGFHEEFEKAETQMRTLYRALIGGFWQDFAEAVRHGGASTFLGPQSPFGLPDSLQFPLPMNKECFHFLGALLLYRRFLVKEMISTVAETQNEKESSLIKPSDKNPGRIEANSGESNAWERAFVGNGMELFNGLNLETRTANLNP